MFSPINQLTALGANRSHQRKPFISRFVELKNVTRFSIRVDIDHSDTTSQDVFTRYEFLTKCVFVKTAPLNFFFMYTYKGPI